MINFRRDFLTKFFIKISSVVHLTLKPLEFPNFTHGINNLHIPDRAVEGQGLADIPVRWGSFL